MKTINLLPSEQRHHLRQQLIVTTIEFALLTTAGLLLASSLWLSSQARTIDQQTAQKQAEKTQLRGKLEEASQLQLKLATIQDRSTSWEQLKNQATNYPELLTAIASAMPAQVRLTQLTTDANQSLAINGTAANRQEVTNFTTNLSQSTHFTNTTLGQTTAQENGVAFTVTTTLVKPKGKK